MRHKRFFVGALALLLTFGLASCELDFRHVSASYEPNNNSIIQGWDDVGDNNIVTWDNVDMSTWSESEQISYYVTATLLLDDLTLDFSYVETEILDYKSNSLYFDADRVYTLVGNKFDLNPLIAKFAIGTGVIVVCVILTVVTSGTATPFACFIAGAAKTSISTAIKGAVMGAAMGAVTSAIKSGGDWEQTLYGSLEGTADGYMWGAIFGAITGGISSEYCFEGDTLVKTFAGLKAISELKEGEAVWTYNESTGQPELKNVITVYRKETEKITALETGHSVLKVTPGHLIYGEKGYAFASSYKEGDYLKTYSGKTRVLSNRSQNTANFTPVYNLNVADNHNYFVGPDEVLVHNTCMNQDYAGKTYKYENTLRKYQETGDSSYLDAYNTLLEKWPDGVKYSELNASGYTSPLFDPYVPSEKGVLLQHTFPEVNYENLKAGTCLVGDSTSSSPDFSKFWRWVADKGFSSSEIANLKSLYTVHHAADMRTLQLVPKMLHSYVKHTGGASFIRQTFGSLLALFGL